MRNNALAILGVIAVLPVLLTGVVQVQAARERSYPGSSALGGLRGAGPGHNDDWLYLQSGSAVRRMTGALSGLAADIYWIRAILHYGDTKRRLVGGPAVPEPPPMLAAATSREYMLLYPILVTTTHMHSPV